MEPGTTARLPAMVGFMLLLLLPAFSPIGLASSFTNEKLHSFPLPVPVSGDHRITRGLYIDDGEWVIAGLVLLAKTSIHEYSGVFVFHLEKGLIGGMVVVDAYSVAVSTRKNLLLVGGKNYLRAYALDSLEELWEKRLGINVRRIELSPDNSLAAIAGDKGGYTYVYIMRVDDERVLGYRRVFEEVKILEWSPHSDKLLVLTDGYGYVLDRNGETIWSASEAPLPLDAKWSGTGKYFGIVSRRGTVTLFNNEGEKLWSVKGGAATIAFIGDDLVLVGYRKSIRAISVSSGEIEWSIDNLELLDHIEAAEPLGGTAIFVSSSGEMVVVGRDGEKRYSGGPLASFKAVKASRGAYIVSSYALNTLAVAPDGSVVARLRLLIGVSRALVYTGDALYVTVYSLNNTYHAYKLSLKDGKLIIKELESGEKEVVVYVGDNSYFVRSHNSLKYVVDGREAAVIRVSKPYLQKIVLSPNGKYFLLTPAGVVYSLVDGRKILSIGKADKYVWSPNSRLIARLYGYYVGIYDLEERKQLYGSDSGEFGETRAASWSSDSRYLAVARSRGVEVYRVESGRVEKIHTLTLDTVPIAVFWTNSGEELAVLEYNRTARGYSIKFYDTESWAPLSSLKLGRNPVLSVDQLGEDTLVYLTRLARGSDKYTIGVVLVDLERKRLKTVDTGVYTYSKHVLRLYPLSPSALIVYDEKKGVILAVSNTQPAQKITPRKIAAPEETTTQSVSATPATAPASHKVTTIINPTTTPTAAAPGTPKTLVKTGRVPMESPLPVVVIIAVIALTAAVVIALKKRWR